MNKYSTIQERNDYESQTFDLIQDYISNKDSYSKETGISINNTTLELSLCNISECSLNEEWYSVNEFISIDNQKQIPDCDKIYNLISKYFFVS